jgi:hypothetical protein
MANKQTAIKPGPGRPKGSQNKTTAVLKEAILLAADRVGSDGKGKGKLTGYCEFLAKNEPRAFAGLLGKVLPMQVTGVDGNPLKAEVQITIVDPR